MTDDAGELQHDALESDNRIPLQSAPATSSEPARSTFSELPSATDAGGPGGTRSDALQGQEWITDEPSTSTPEAVNSKGLPLRSKLSPAELNVFLGDVDREMRSLINGQSGINDPKAIASEVERVVKLKLVASQRLIDHPQAQSWDRVAGKRGFLQALSHLAAMGDLKSANELQKTAEAFSDDADGELRSDSQLVLIGFAIESLRHGKEGAAQRVLELLQTLTNSRENVDVATLMVMGQAKDTLLQYEHPQEARNVRDLILKRFGAAKDPEVARMAARIASSGFIGSTPGLDHLEQLRQQFVSDAEESKSASVSTQQWEAALADTFGGNLDVLTIEFLAGVSLEAEAVGRSDIAAATYEQLRADVVDRQDSLGQVARTALQARENRQQVIGQVFDPDLPSVDGSPLQVSDYEGKVVLMPFWSSAYPESLAMLPEFKTLESKYPKQVAIIGMNLDMAGTDVKGFMKDRGISFRSFRSESDPSNAIINEAAYRFGAVTLLFVAILDQEGRVAGIDFSGRDLTKEVESLIR